MDLSDFVLQQARQTRAAALCQVTVGPFMTFVFEKRGSAVQYVRFPVPDAAALQRGPAALIVDHPTYTPRQELRDAVRSSLAQDLLPEGG